MCVTLPVLHLLENKVNRKLCNSEGREEGELCMGVVMCSSSTKYIALPSQTIFLKEEERDALL